MPAPHFIKNDDELKQLHLLGKGFIYNDYSGNIPSGALGNVLHLAECTNVGRSSTKYPKVFFEDIGEAAKWISNERGPEGSRWRRCVCCRSEHAAATRNPRVAPEPTKQVALSKPASQVSRKPQRREKTGQDQMPPPFTEGQVEDYLQPWLEANGYSVKKRVRVDNGIIDMVAQGQNDEWIIEAKGEDRGGFGTAEMNFRIGIAQICSRMTKQTGRKFALAIPLTAHFERLLIKHRDFTVFEKMEIWLFASDRDGSITKLSPDQIQIFVDGLMRSP